MQAGVLPAPPCPSEAGLDDETHGRSAQLLSEGWGRGAVVAGLRARGGPPHYEEPCLELPFIAGEVSRPQQWQLTLDLDDTIALALPSEAQHAAKRTGRAGQLQYFNFRIREGG
jgi:hypothetical protein